MDARGCARDVSGRRPHRARAAATTRPARRGSGWRRWSCDSGERGHPAPRLGGALGRWVLCPTPTRGWGEVRASLRVSRDIPRTPRFLITSGASALTPFLGLSSPCLPNPYSLRSPLSALQLEAPNSNPCREHVKQPVRRETETWGTSLVPYRGASVRGGGRGRTGPTRAAPRVAALRGGGGGPRGREARDGAPRGLPQPGPARWRPRVARPHGSSEHAPRTSSCGPGASACPASAAGTGSPRRVHVV